MHLIIYYMSDVDRCGCKYDTKYWEMYNFGLCSSQEAVISSLIFVWQTLVEECIILNCGR